MNAEVLGVSVDSPEHNRAWAEKAALPFRLLSDVSPKGRVGKAFGVWDDPAAVPDTLTAVLAELGKRYLPWVSRACVDGVADVVFENGVRVAVRATDFLRDARATLLARYVESRNERLDAVLERAGILPFFADHEAHAGSIPDFRQPPRPALNRPFPPAEA